MRERTPSSFHRENGRRKDCDFSLDDGAGDRHFAFGGTVMVYIPEAEEIYFSKTQEYFREVLGNYANGNYRSAVVMLYSVAVCDLLFKLRELVDMYNDTVAVEILQEVEKCRNLGDNKSKSRWEKEFVDNIYRKTKLLDLEAYTNLNHLYDHRNFSAHPALNDKYELISPSKETTIALIKNVLEEILIKPPIFIKNITDMMLKDLSEKKFLYQDEPEKFREYLKRKYFDRMPTSMKKSTFRSFWKLCFCLPDDEDCQRNIDINRNAMEVLFSETDGILEFMKSDSMFLTTSPNDNCVMQLCMFLSQYPTIYSVLSQDTKLQITTLTSKNSKANIISWFLSANKATHIQKMIDTYSFAQLADETIDFVSNQYELCGELSCFIDYCIEYFGHSGSFDDANNRYYSAVRPFLSKMSRQQYVRLIAVVNENDQIHNRNASYSTNTEIAMAAFITLGADFDYSQYPRYLFDKEMVLRRIMGAGPLKKL